MNIRDRGMWPETLAPRYCHEFWRSEILEPRRATFFGFAAIEADKGFVQAPVSLNTPRGQDSVRLFIARVLEEYCEAIQAVSEDHWREELIDAFNYLQCIPFLDLALEAYSRLPDPVFRSSVRPGLIGMGRLANTLMTPLDLFRNRSWMNNAQSLYFDGYADLSEAINLATHQLMSYFPDWPTFWAYYTAKNNVLQFRLRSLY